MRKRMTIVLGTLLGLVCVWLAGDLIYSLIVANRVKKWEASIERDGDGVQEGSQAYTVGSGAAAILLIHGINDSPQCYHKMAPVLAEEGFTCRVMRLPGFALPNDRYAQATKEEWLAAVDSEIQSPPQISPSPGDCRPFAGRRRLDRPFVRKPPGSRRRRASCTGRRCIQPSQSAPLNPSLARVREVGAAVHQGHKLSVLKRLPRHRGRRLPRPHHLHAGHWPSRKKRFNSSTPIAVAPPNSRPR